MPDKRGKLPVQNHPAQYCKFTQAVGEVKGPLIHSGSLQVVNTEHSRATGKYVAVEGVRRGQIDSTELRRSWRRGSRDEQIRQEIYYVCQIHTAVVITVTAV